MEDIPTIVKTRKKETEIVDSLSSFQCLVDDRTQLPEHIGEGERKVFCYCFAVKCMIVLHSISITIAVVNMMMLQSNRDASAYSTFLDLIMLNSLPLDLLVMSSLPFRKSAKWLRYYIHILFGMKCCLFLALQQWHKYASLDAFYGISLLLCYIFYGILLLLFYIASLRESHSTSFTPSIGSNHHNGTIQEDNLSLTESTLPSSNIGRASNIENKSLGNGIIMKRGAPSLPIRTECIV